MFATLPDTNGRIFSGEVTPRWITTVANYEGGKSIDFITLTKRH